MLRDDRIEEAMEAAGLDGIIVNSPTNAYYFSGVESIAHTVFGEPLYGLWSRTLGGPYLVMPTRETDLLVGTDIAPDQVYPYGGTNAYQGDGLTDSEETALGFQTGRTFDDEDTALRTAVSECVDGDRLGLERETLDSTTDARLQSILSGFSIEGADGLLHDLRRVKTSEEIDRIRRSAEITESAMEAAMEALEPGMTERELANEFWSEMGAQGGDPLFTTVGFGDHTTFTHPKPGDRAIQEGDIVRWDAGCTYEGYASDIGRTFVFGDSEPEAVEIYEALYDGLQATLGELSDGITTDQAYEAGVEAVRSSGVPALAEFQPIHLGHGIGLEVYDPPRIEAEPHEVREQMTFCVEPPYNEFGLGGFLIEEEIVITDDGYESFTSAPETLRDYR